MKRLRLLMRKEDIKLGDLLWAHNDPDGEGYGRGRHPKRLVLVVSLDDNRLTVLDCGVRTSISSVWLKPL